MEVTIFHEMKGRDLPIATMRQMNRPYEGRLASTLITLIARIRVNPPGRLAGAGRPAAMLGALTTRGRVLLVTLGLLAGVAVPSWAQTPSTPGDRVTSLPEPDDEPELDEVRYTIGMAGSVSPTYSGSDELGYAIAPAARIVWRGYSISTSSVARASASAGSNRSSETGLTGPLYRTNEFAFGFGASINRGRDISEADARLGLKELRGTLIGRMRMRYYFNPNLVLTAMLVGDLLGRQRGLQVPVGLSWRRSLKPGLLLSTDIGMTLADAKSMDNNYGIGPEERAASGLPLYRPHSGIREVSGSVGLVGEPSEHWVWVARLSLVKLVGPAADSPIVKQTFQPALLVGFAYRFTLH
jgi:outer membrane scaffolding protein for murein synthesis (MipA/OmpV family)